MWHFFDLNFHLCWNFYRCWMVWHWIQDLLWCNHKPGLDNWELDSGWICIQGKGVEDAHSGSDLTADTGRHCLEVFKLHILHFAAENAESCEVLMRCWMFVTSGGFQSLRGGLWPTTRSTLLIITSWDVLRWTTDQSVWTPSHQRYIST